MSSSARSAALFDPRSQHRAILACVGVSIVLHAAVLLGFPGMRASAPSTTGPKVLTATLSSPAPSMEPAPAIEKPAPPVVQPPPPPKPTQQAGAESRPALTSPAASPRALAQPPEPTEPAPSAPPQTTGVATAAPPVMARAPAESLAPASTPGEPATQPTPEAVDGRTLQEYRLDLMASAKKFKRYPVQAMEKGWEGRVEIRVVVRPSGMILSASIKTPSGYRILDDQALDMVRRAQTRTPIPPALRGREFTIDIPVIFELQAG